MTQQTDKAPGRLHIVGDHNLPDSTAWSISLDGMPMHFVQRVEYIVDAETGENHASVKFISPTSFDIQGGRFQFHSYQHEQEVVHALETLGYKIEKPTE